MLDNPFMPTKKETGICYDLSTKLVRWNTLSCKWNTLYMARGKLATKTRSAIAAGKRKKLRQHERTDCW